MRDEQRNNLFFIYRALREAGATQAGACGLLGNLWCESGLIPTNLQNTYEKKFALSDSVYTEKVDNGQYTNFVKDSGGYGLAQWTYWTRKENLLNYCKSRGLSIGDLGGQVGFLLEEMKSGYKGVWNIICSTDTIKMASDIVLTSYERPKDQSDTAKATRARYGEEMQRELASHGYLNNYQKPVDEDGDLLPQPQPVVDYKEKYEALLSKIRKIAEES